MALQIAEIIAKVTGSPASKRYLYSAEIPYIFECLLAGLLHHQPDNPVLFLRNCITAVQEAGGLKALKWNSFVETNQSETCEPLSSIAAKMAPKDTKVVDPKASLGKERGRFLRMRTPDHASVPTEPGQLIPLPKHLIDNGRKPDLSAAPMILAYIGPIQAKGAPELRGISSTSQVLGIYNSGFVNPDEKEDKKIQEELMFLLYGNRDGDNPVILINFPRNGNQMQWLLTRVGGITSAVCVDLDEDGFRYRMSEKSLVSAHAVNYAIEQYKSSTLPVIHWLDRAGKLRLIPAADEEDANNELFNYFARPGMERVRTLTSDSLLKTVERKENVELTPVLDPFPQSKGTQTSLLHLLFVGPVANYDVYRLGLKGRVRHFLDYTNAMEQLPEVFSLNDGPIVCLNFPWDRVQLLWLLSKVGLDLADVIVVDISEITTRSRLISAHLTSDEVDEALRNYKKNTIPIIHWFDRAGKTRMVDGEEDDVIVMRNIMRSIITR